MSNTTILNKTLMAAMLTTMLLTPTTIHAQTVSPTQTQKQDKKEGFKDKIQNGFQNIAGNRAVVVSGKLTSKNGTTFTVEKDGKSYTVNTDGSTVFHRRFWGKSSLEEIQVGDVLNVIGKWTDDTKTMITAKQIRDSSIQIRHGVFIGKLLTINGGTWTLESRNRSTQTAIVSSSTKFVNRRGETISQGDIQAGHRVRIKGLWNRNNNTITDITHVKDFNLPSKIPTPTP